MRFSASTLPIAALGAVLLGCAEPTPDLPRLEFLSSMPRELTVGDTTEALAVNKYSATSTGRETKVVYYSFTLTSADTSVIKVVQGSRLAGMKAGTSAITASDDKEVARTPSSVAVTVK